MASLYAPYPSELPGQDLESCPNQYEIVPSLPSNTYQTELGRFFFFSSVECIQGDIYRSVLIGSSF